MWLEIISHVIKDYQSCDWRLSVMWSLIFDHVISSDDHVTILHPDPWCRKSKCFDKVILLVRKQFKSVFFDKSQSMQSIPAPLCTLELMRLRVCRCLYMLLLCKLCLKSTALPVLENYYVVVLLTCINVVFFATFHSCVCWSHVHTGYKNIVIQSDVLMAWINVLMVRINVKRTSSPN